MTRKPKLNELVEAFLMSNDGIFSYDEIGKIHGTIGRAIGPCMASIGKRNMSITNRVISKKEKEKLN